MNEIHTLSNLFQFKMISMEQRYQSWRPLGLGEADPKVIFYYCNFDAELKSYGNIQIILYRFCRPYQIGAGTVQKEQPLQQTHRVACYPEGGAAF